ncbi:hypothetical protein BYT27DRAFT_7007357, partial [Phlegmacium glaucopus]
QDIFHPIMGKVLVYASNEDPANLSLHNMKPRLFIKHQVTSSIQPVLTRVADKYSPIQSNRLYTFEGDLWCVRGHYDKAFEENEELMWSESGGEHLAHILMASFIFYFYFVF